MKFLNAYTEMIYKDDTPLNETMLSDIVANWGKWNVMFDDKGNVKDDFSSKNQYNNLMGTNITSGVAGADASKDLPYYETDLDKIKEYLLKKAKEIAAREKRNLTKADVALIDTILQRVKKTGEPPVAKPQIDPSEVTIAPGSKYKGGAGYKTDYAIKNGQIMTARNAANS